MEHSVPIWELALTVVLFAASGGIGYASSVLLWDLLSGRDRRRQERRSRIRTIRRGASPPEV